ncbi:MAG: hypothetical protein OHK0012_04500 [Synechococcales cyanobacterium]
MTTWDFDTEFSLEEFLWASLESLLNLKPLARQHSTESQICDILATTSDRQLVVLELKNVEDRYVVPQLTRYYSSLLKERPFPDQVDYSLPIRLIAIAPSFHAHNYVDREHSQLDFEFWIFRIDGPEIPQTFCLNMINSEVSFSAEIPIIFHGLIHKEIEGNETPIASIRVIGRPPKSLRESLEKLDLEKQEYLLTIRRRILESDERMAELGLSVRTQYGLKKGDNGIPDNRVCAEILQKRISRDPGLYLRLPYPKGGFSWNKKLSDFGTWDKRMSMANIPLFPRDWEKGDNVSFFLGKSYTSPSHNYVFNTKLYSQICSRLLDTPIKLETTEDLIDLAVREWKANLFAPPQSRNVEQENVPEELRDPND